MADSEASEGPDPCHVCGEPFENIGQMVLHYYGGECER